MTPSPAGVPVLGHLPRWTRDPLSLLTEGARLGPVFELRLWRRVTVGFLPDWNRLVLRDIHRFRSRGSLSQLSPYLSGGVVATDGPEHGRRRAELNPSFHRRAVTALVENRLTGLAAEQLPTGPFDAVEWSSRLVRCFLLATFVGDRLPVELLDAFLAPLDRPLPGPLVRHPLLFARMNRALRRVLRDPQDGTLAVHFAGLERGVEELRVALAAAYDTTAHVLAWTLWELAGRADLTGAGMTAQVVEEALRMYPAGWLGSRVCTEDTEYGDQLLPAGRMVLYSPFLTHRSAELWADPTAFRPERFLEGRPTWGYLPFSAGERTCLGAGLATLMLRVVVDAFGAVPLRRISGDPRPRGGLTLTPRGPLVLSGA